MHSFLHFHAHSVHLVTDWLNPFQSGFTPSGLGVDVFSPDSAIDIRKSLIAVIHHRLYHSLYSVVSPKVPYIAQALHALGQCNVLYIEFNSSMP